MFCVGGSLAVHHFVSIQRVNLLRETLAGFNNFWHTKHEETFTISDHDKRVGSQWHERR